MDAFALQQVVVALLVLFSAVAFASFSTNNALYGCGIRRLFGVTLIHQAQNSELGQWPWHAAVYHRIANGTSEYKCGGTLIDQHHVLTAAHCVINSNRKVLEPNKVSVQLGKHDLYEYPGQVQIVEASKIHVYPEYSPNRHDVALVVMQSRVFYSDYVIPICLQRTPSAWVHDLVGQRGSVAGWGETESDRVSKTLKTAQMLVVNNTECVESDPTLFARFISQAIYCASDRNGTSVCRGDSGGGMFFEVADHWELRGIVSFSGPSETGSCDTSKYVVFTNVARYIGWIKNLTDGDAAPQHSLPKRISERKCEQYAKLIKKQGNGVCLNSWYTHVVGIVGGYEETILLLCSSTIISESFVISAAHCSGSSIWEPVKVRIGQKGDVDIKRYIRHPDYIRDEYLHDIMLVELTEQLSFNSRFMPACLVNEATENLYDTLILTGFSRDEEHQLYEGVNNRIISLEECNRLFRKNSITAVNITSAHICTITTYDIEDPTYVYIGFSGGPLQLANSRSCIVTLVGVMDIGIPIRRNKTERKHGQHVEVYTRIVDHLDWIEHILWGAEASVEAVSETTTVAATTKTTVATTSQGQTLRYSRDFFFPDGFDSI